MKLLMPCMHCLKDHALPKEDEITFVEFRDDGRYELTCKNGHHSITILQQQKFEILFDIGAYAIHDGYYREAVSSFTSSLERFYEFYIKVIAIKHDVNGDTFKDSWSRVSKQSERQLGAFIFTYTFEHGKSPVLLSNSNVAIRNDVIHKGKIPSKAEAIDYGNAVLNVIRPVLKDLKENYKESVGQAVSQHLASIRNESDRNKAVATMGVRTILSLSIMEPDHDNKTLDEALSALIKYR